MVVQVFSGLEILLVTIYIKKITIREFRLQIFRFFLNTDGGYMAFSLKKYWESRIKFYGIELTTHCEFSNLIKIKKH